MPIKIKRSAVAAKVPTTMQLALGELAVNTHDGKLYLKKDDGAESIVEIGPVTSVAGRTGAVTLAQADVSGLIDALAAVANPAFASQAQAEAGAAEMVAMNPLRTAQAIAALAAGGASVDVQEFASSGTWTKPGSGTITIVYLVGGGGSGGAARDSGDAAAAGGGGGGGGAFRIFDTSALNATETVTIGAGGSAKSRSSNGGSNGNDGGASTFGAHLTANGGGGGGAGTGASDASANGGLPGLDAGSGGSADDSNGRDGGPGGVFGGGGGGGASDNNGKGVGGAAGWAGGGGAGDDGGGTAADGMTPGGGGGGAATRSSNNVTSGAGGDGYAYIVTI